MRRRPGAGGGGGGIEDGRTEVVELTVDGRARRYRVVPPDDYDASRPWPVIIGYHGGGEDNTGQKMEVNWIAQRGKSAFLVFPDGEGGGWCVPGMDPNDPIGDPQKDARFTQAMIQDLGKRWKIDQDKVYAVGFSNGGMEVWNLVCNHAEWFAGFGIMSASMTDGEVASCKPSVTRPIVYLHGTADHSFGGRVSEGDHHLVLVSSAETVSAITKAYGCKKEPKTETREDRCGNGRVPTIHRFEGCKGDAPIEYVKIENGSHSWAGGRGGCENVDASEEMLGVFGLSGR